MRLETRRCDNCMEIKHQSGWLVVEFPMGRQDFCYECAGKANETAREVIKKQGQEVTWAETILKARWDRGNK